MFTGIIEQLGKIVDLKNEGSNLRLTIQSDLTNELKVDQSVAHNGVCLTVEKISEDSSNYEVVAIDETLEKTNLGRCKVNDDINIERCMRFDGRLDGHIVQGHVDQVASVKDIQEKDGSWVFQFELSQASKLIVEKGSICVNGVSLTAFDIHDNGFTVAIIPYTYEHTNFNRFKVNDLVNIEFDIIGKYVQRLNG